MNILDEVKSILYERQGTYDKPENNFERIANYWNSHTNNKPGMENVPDEIKKLFMDTPKDIAEKMVLMKLAREQFKHKKDGVLDMIGYCVCLAQIYGEDGKDETI
jgi:hypothetical protein